MKNESEKPGIKIAGDKITPEKAEEINRLGYDVIVKDGNLITIVPSQSGKERDKGRSGDNIIPFPVKKEKK
ncbi:MAG TPA: hypothetical protein PKI75_01370 [Candidatus Woesebacteria bacterium]|nr:hypothetical protein [Candidatus Woesebacteria bacterium]